MNKKLNILGFDYRLFFSLLVISILYDFGGPLRYFGALSLIIIIIYPLVNYFFVLKTKVKTNDIFFNLIIVYSIYNIFLLFRTFSIQSVYYCILQIIILLNVYVLFHTNISQYVFKRLVKISKYTMYLLLLLFFIIYALNDFNIENSYSFISLISCCFALFLISLYNEASKIILFVRGLIFVSSFLLFKERTIALGAIVYIICCFFSSSTKSLKRYSSFLFLIIFLVILAIPNIYTMMSFDSRFQDFNRLISELTGKNLFSGRQVLWHTAHELMSVNPYGYGLDVSFLYNYGINSSIHNTYYYVFLQGGIIQFIIFILILFSIYRLLSRGKTNKMRSILVFFVVLFIADFGTIMISTHVVYSMYLWLAVSIGYMCKNNNRMEVLYE